MQSDFLGNSEVAFFFIHPVVGAMDDEWEADLVIMDSLSQQNNGYKYVLTVIDVLSKYAWVEAIKAKTGIIRKLIKNSWRKNF